MSSGWLQKMLLAKFERICLEMRWCVECAADYKFSELQRTLIFRCPRKSTSKHPKWGCSRACLCGALSRAKPIIAKESKEEG